LYFILTLTFFSAQGTQFPRAVNIEKKMKHVWKGHGVDSEIGNVSARQAALNRWTATDKRWKRKTVFLFHFIFIAFLYAGWQTRRKFPIQ